MSNPSLSCWTPWPVDMPVRLTLEAKRWVFSQLIDVAPAERERQALELVTQARAVDLAIARAALEAGRREAPPWLLGSAGDAGE